MNVPLDNERPLESATICSDSYLVREYAPNKCFFGMNVVFSDP